MAADVENNSTVWSSSSSNASPLTRKIEVICKSIAWSIIIISASVHMYRLFQVEHAGQTCPLLLESGHWIGDKWQPDGCMMHEYIESEMQTCLQGQHVVFIGDSRMRSLYFQLANSVSPEPVTTGYHENLKYEDKSNMNIEFYWIPTLNDDLDKLLQSLSQLPSGLPHLIIMGVATWTIKTGKLASVVDYQAELNKLSDIMAAISRNFTMVNTIDPPLSRFHREPQLIWIMQDPVVESKLAARRKSIVNDKIDMYNYAAQKTLESKCPYVRLMKSTPMMAAGKPEETVDGLHYSSFVLAKKVDAILNAFCNDYVYPDDASCCKDLERITKLQFNMFAVFGTCVILWFLMLVSRKTKERSVKGFTEEEKELYETNTVLPWLYDDQMYTCLKAMAKLAGIMLYIFLADSSLLYNKDHKHYSHAAFFIPLIAVFVVGLVTRAPVQKTTVLNPEQLEEWKGWMIVVIMLYNYTHAEEILPVFVNVRLLVASFLYLIGFVYFRQFWYGGDFGLYKICKALAHMNVFCVVLCLTMGHPYQFYTIVPLLSFWLFVVYVTLALFPRITHDLVQADPKKNFWMIGKLVVLLVAVIIIWANENVCEWLFSQKIIRELFIDSNGEIQQWRFNSGLNRYAVVFGMLCAYVYVNLKQYGFIKDDDNNSVMLPSTKISLLVLVFTLAGLIGYEVQAFTCHSKTLCDHTHSAASCIPILAFVLLRNVPGFLRSKYSVFFAWVGEMSLELFLAQYHIWLANDTHGIHVLIPGYPTANALVTSFTFLCVVHEVKKICTILADALVTKDVLVMLRRLLIFIVMLFVIWWHKTHEKKPGFNT